MNETKLVRDYWASKVEDWSNWADPMAKLAAGLNQPILDSLDIQEGDHILDLASGVGEPAFSEAKLSGSSGLTIATDLVPEMLSALKKREGSDILQFSAADMQSLPFAEYSFNHISCRFGIMFVPDQLKSLAECFRVLKPLGKASFLVWGKQEEQRIFHLIRKALKSCFNIEMDEDYNKIFALHAEGHLSGMMTRSGFEIVEDKQITFSPIAPKGVKFWTSQLELSFGHAIKELSKEQLNQLDQEIEKRLQEFALSDKGYQMHLTMRLVTGQKP
ncbi:class I SAM-dependent methyltransferase [Curvivirga aplysinae]|uniref:class I SAM-dependent methyltransferase n=1 Tax=Curvivirga aplysinae TaxID=2529852 RepID=UPI0012BC9B3C|nr:class I SAM-dependent methyltransferase [Curvivirga aplysinae]MTI10038.1 methyltransferase domain-containing protein [Curvivirga aplysinae]